MEHVNGCAKEAPERCDSGPVQAYRDLTPLEVAECRNRELEKLLADERIEAQRREKVFQSVLQTECENREHGFDYRDDRIGHLHNRTIELESALKTIRRLTHDPEISTVIRLALVGIHSNENYTP